MSNAPQTPHTIANTWIDNARLVAAVAVVVLHISASPVVFAPIGSNSWWAGNTYDSATRWCVPVFVMLSGYLLLPTAVTSDTLGFLKKRASRLLIPLLFWGLFYQAWQLWQATPQVRTALWAALPEQWLRGAPHFHLWFLFMLTGLSLVTPWLARLMAHLSIAQQRHLAWTLLALGALHNAAFALLEHATAPQFFTLFLPYLGYYVWAATPRCASVTAQSSRTKAVQIGLLLLSILATMLGLYVLSQMSGLAKGLYFYEYVSITVLPMSLLVFVLLQSWTRPILGRWTPQAARLSFGVYLIHPLLIEVLSPYLQSLQTLGTWLFIPLVSSAVLLSSFAVAGLLHSVPWLRRTL
ncbi:hypothetical protein E9531_01335 [Lampropedia puyangensis]|uniref:Acyltransferase 3 domain-containing protein n=1 Tax=Lampropedia puyangensis TaxID=1330072 RepID=A0A4V4GS91_9BURK|nr:acyltransferase family protein [Lampropedia puyangensis]THU05226.1 hypothetical protein E9531_01335 [Lampropedia puyangensis]